MPINRSIVGRNWAAEVEAPDQTAGNRLHVRRYMLCRHSPARSYVEIDRNVGSLILGEAIFGAPEQPADRNPRHGQSVFGTAADEPATIGMGRQRQRKRNGWESDGFREATRIEG